MFGKLSILFKVLQHGNELRDKKFWKSQQAYVLPVVCSVLVGLVQLAQSFGITLPLDENACMYIAGMLYFAVNTWFTLATTSSLGIPSKKAEEPSVDDVLETPLEQATEAVQEAVEEAVVEVVKDVKQDALAAANDWFRRNK